MAALITVLVLPPWVLLGGWVWTRLGRETPR
jgi:hypothetical protein